MLFIDIIAVRARDVQTPVPVFKANVPLFTGFCQIFGVSGLDQGVGDGRDISLV
jgi:hypothetical protein